MSIQEILKSYLSYGHWGSVAVWFLIFASFIAFLPFNRKSRRRQSSIYIAFIAASAFEMFGIPLSMYFIAWALGVSLPRGLLWGHTLQQHIGYWGMFIGFALNIVGGLLIISGWRKIFRGYWSKGEGKLVKDGIYAYIRHPQYTGFILMTLGLLIHWATIPLMVMWPLPILQYYRLARKEERDMEDEFGDEYREYKEKVPMFILYPQDREKPRTPA